MNAARCHTSTIVELSRCERNLLDTRAQCVCVCVTLMRASDRHRDLHSTCARCSRAPPRALAPHARSCSCVRRRVAALAVSYLNEETTPRQTWASRLRRERPTLPTIFRARARACCGRARAMQRVRRRDATERSEAEQGESARGGEERAMRGRAACRYGGIVFCFC